MVKTTQSLAPGRADAEAAEAWLGRATARFGAREAELLHEALALVRSRPDPQALAGGEPLLEHALGTAGILLDLRLDAEAVAAGLLAASVESAPAALLVKVRERCGASVAALVEGVARMAEIGALAGSSRTAVKPGAQAAQLEALRKMLLAMVQDVRVVLVKLADHTQGLRYLVRAAESERRREAARLTQEIFAPLANRLGVWQLKWEMEDLAFRILEPETYRTIARQLDEKRADRERYIEQVIGILRGELERAGIRAEVTGRPKHIFSIYKKIQKKAVDFESLYDVRGVRILVEEVKDCYAALGLVHHLWTPIPKEFDDYIAKPKPNGYRSLHTAVIGPEAKALEVQIRTHEMHQHAELGVAAHWRYKEGLRTSDALDQRIAWLRQILDWKQEPFDSSELAEQFRHGLFEETIYVLTPQGKVIDLPRGATPIDFAYHVHTELGHRCRGAKVDGTMVPLNTPLANGQRVEILAARQGGPSRDWLNPELGYVRSATARAKIRQWFKRQDQETAAAEGRAVVERELQRLGLSGLSLERLAARLHFTRVVDFLAEVGRGEIRPRQLQEAARALAPAGALVQPPPEEALPRLRPPAPSTRSAVLVVGVDRLLTVPARCCKPLPPEPIVGFVTRGRGISVHRAGCANVARLDRQRLVSAQWGEGAEATYAVEVEVEAANRPGLVREIGEAVAREKIRVHVARSASGDAAARVRLTLEVADLAQLGRVLALIRQVPGVMRAVRR